MKTIIKYIAIALFPMISVGNAYAQNQNMGAYVTDTSGRVVKSASGLCWRTSSWTPQTAIKECDPELFVVKEELPPRKQEIIIEPYVKPEPPKKVEEVTETILIQKIPVTLVLKTFFNFDKFDLNEQNRNRLRDVAEKIQEFDVDVIYLRGHADRIGTDQYNQRLSQKRANIVRNELINLGVDPAKIQVEALGESEPVVECAGKTNARVISCLAPNRRVEVEVMGIINRQ